MNLFYYWLQKYKRSNEIRVLFRVWILVLIKKFYSDKLVLRRPKTKPSINLKSLNCFFYYITLQSVVVTKNGNNIFLWRFFECH